MPKTKKPTTGRPMTAADVRRTLELRSVLGIPDRAPFIVHKTARGYLGFAPWRQGAVRPVTHVAVVALGRVSSGFRDGLVDQLNAHSNDRRLEPSLRRFIRSVALAIVETFTIPRKKTKGAKR